MQTKERADETRHANTRGEWLAATITCSPRTHRSDRSVCFFKPSSENENANGAPGTVHQKRKWLGSREGWQWCRCGFQNGDLKGIAGGEWPGDTSVSLD